MNIDTSILDKIRSLDLIFNEHLNNSYECGLTLSQLFSILNEPDPYIVRIKHLEEKGDRLTAEAYSALELLEQSEIIHLTEQFIKRLDDIVDGINDTARLIDICMPRKIEDAAQQILKTLLTMIAGLQAEIAHYPDNEMANVTRCREILKSSEENADAIYHDWRKLQRRINVLPLVDEMNWTEIMGNLEQTTDAAYHAALILERMVKYRLRS